MFVISSSDKVADFTNRSTNESLLKGGKLMFDALVLLVEIGRNCSPDYAGITSRTGIASPEIGVLSRLQSLRTNPGFSAVAAFLAMYNSYLDAIATIPVNASITDADIITDMATVGAGGVKATSTQAIQRPMFDLVYNQIKGKIAASATNAGKPTLASAISANGLFNTSSLPKPTPNGSSDGVLLGPATPLMYQYADKLTDDIMYRGYTSGKEAQNVERIKATFMAQWGGGGATQVQNAKATELAQRQEREKRNSPFYTPPVGSRSVEEEKPINESDAQWINGSFITAMAVFFSEYWKKIAKLPLT